MFKRFVDGLIFGAGFAIALVVVWTVGYMLLMPRLTAYFVSQATQTRQPEFDNPREAKAVEPTPSIESEQKAFSFFKHAGVTMKIPPGGGILSMAPIATAKGSKRPSTYQLWLTEDKLWQIRTTEEKAEVEELPYPKEASMEGLGKVMFEKVGPASGQSTMTVSPVELARLKSNGHGGEDRSLNGTLKISVEGVVFVLPAAFGS